MAPDLRKASTQLPVIFESPEESAMRTVQALRSDPRMGFGAGIPLKITIVMGMPDMSGGAKVIALYADRLAKRGHEVVVVSAGRPPPTPRQRLRTLVQERKLLRYERLPANHLDGSDIDHRLIDRYRPIVDSDVPDGDVIVATWWQTAPWVAGLSRRKGAKAYFMQDYGAPGMELTDLIPTWRYPMHIITIADWLVGLMREHGVDQPISVVRNSVETEYFHAEPRGKQAVPTIGFVYRESWVKGYDLVLEAFNRARAHHPSLRLLTYGSRHPTLQMPPGMDFKFRPPTPALREVYSACDAWLFASRREGFGLPVLEAMACRTPVIAVPAGAAPELVAQGGGVMVKQDDPADMAEAIGRFAAMSESEWRSYSDRAYDTVQGYGWDDAVTRFEAALVRAIDLSGREEADRN